MEYLKKYKIFESDSNDHMRKSFNLLKKIYNFSKREVTSIIEKHNFFNIEIFYPGMENIIGEEKYQFQTPKHHIEEMTDDEIIHYMEKDNIDMYNLNIVFGIKLILNSNGEKNMGYQTPMILTENILKELPSKYRILDLSEDGHGNEYGVWFVVEYSVSDYLDKIGDIFKKINTESI